MTDAEFYERVDRLLQFLNEDRHVITILARLEEVREDPMRFLLKSAPNYWIDLNFLAIVYWYGVLSKEQKQHYIEIVEAFQSLLDSLIDLLRHVKVRRIGGVGLCLRGRVAELLVVITWSDPDILFLGQPVRSIMNNGVPEELITLLEMEDEEFCRCRRELGWDRLTTPQERRTYALALFEEMSEDSTGLGQAIYWKHLSRLAGKREDKYGRN